MKIPRLRWWLCGLLFASTVINYVDRQTLSLLAPELKRIHHWSNSDYAVLVIAFRVAYAIGQTLSGRWMDRVGTRRGLTVTVAFYSTVSVLTSLANGFEFRRVPISSRRRRIGQLAGSDQGGIGMVSSPGAGAGYSFLR
jgi:sugar phosphate permease